MTLKTRKSSPTQQMKASIKASPTKSRAWAAPAKSRKIIATSPPPTSKNKDKKSSSPKTDKVNSTNELKLNLRSKNGIKSVSLGEERDELQAKKDVDYGTRETEEEERPNFIEAEKMWISVEDMTRKAAIAMNPVWDKFQSSAGDSPFPPGATAELKGLAVVAAFANYKALQAKAEQRAIDVEVWKQMKTRSKRHAVQVAALDKAQKEKFAAKSKMLRMWSSLSSADKKAIGGLGQVERDLFQGVEANVFLKLDKVKKDFVSSGTAVNEANGEAIQNASPGKVQGTRKYDATQTTRSSNKSSLSGMVTSYLFRPPLLTEIKEDHEDDDATQQTASTNTKLGLRSLVLTDGDSTVLACESSDHETVETVETAFTKERRNSLLEDLVAFIRSDESSVLTKHASDNSLCEEEENVHGNTETKVESPPDEPFLAPMKIERATSARSAPIKETLAPVKIERSTSTRSVPVFPSMKQNSSAAPVAAKAFTADDTNSVKSIKSAKSVGTKSVGTKSVDDQTAGEKSLDTIKTSATSKTPKSTSTNSVCTNESVGTTVVSHEDDDQSLVSNASAFVYRSTVGQALSNLFSREEGESVDDNDDKDGKDDDATLTTHLSKKTTLVNHNAADGIEAYRRSRKDLSKPATFENDEPILAFSHKKQYEEEIVPQRNCLTHAFIKCDDFFSCLFCCQENVETKLQKSEAKEWSECYSYCKRFLHQDNDNFVEGESFITWLNTVEAQATSEEKSLSKFRVYKLKSLLIPVATEKRRQYEELRFALDNEMMATIHGVENLDYAIKKAAVTEFNRNYYQIMLKGENHDVVVQQVARIIEGLGFERSLPPPPLTRAEKREEWLNYFKEMEIEIYNSDSEVRFKLDKLQFSFTAEDEEAYLDKLQQFSFTAEDAESHASGEVTEYTKDTTTTTHSNRSKMFQRFLLASSGREG